MKLYRIVAMSTPNLELELKKSEAKYRSIVEFSKDAILLVDTKKRVLEWNPGAEELYGYKRSEVIGKLIPIVPKSKLRELNTIHKRLSAGVSVQNFETQRMRKDGTIIDVVLTLSPIMDPGHNVVAVSSIARDITAEKIARLKMQRDGKLLKKQVASLQSRLQQLHTFGEIIGKSREMATLFEGIMAAARNDSAVLIIGESGTGKELVARAIHANCARSKGPFVPVNCGAIPKDLIESEFFGHRKGAFTSAEYTTEGLFKKADGGVIFLDEIAEMYKETQVKLLRVLQDKIIRPIGSTDEFPVNVKVISATNRSLSDLIDSHLIRDDLYYRVSVITINTPPLRQHTEDIPLLVKHYIDKFNAHFNMDVKGIDREALNVLMGYAWPGNVRELENLIEGLFAMQINESIKVGDLPDRLFTQSNRHGQTGARDQRHTADGVITDRGSSLKATELAMINTALQDCNGNKSKAAKILGISRTLLYRRLNEMKTNCG